MAADLVDLQQGCQDEAIAPDTVAGQQQGGHVVPRGLAQPGLFPACKDDTNSSCLCLRADLGSALLAFWVKLISHSMEAEAGHS